MPASSNDHVQHQATPEPPYYRPLLQLHNSSSCIGGHPGPSHVQPQADALPNTEPSISEQRELIADDDDDDLLSGKHEGRLLSLTPTSVVSPIPRPASATLSPSPPAFHGHTRSPVLVRPPTMLENISRTVRNYVPTSIPVPVATLSPPRVSMPLNFISPSVGQSHSFSERESTTSTSPSERRRAYPHSRTRSSLGGSPELQTAFLSSEGGDIARGNQHLTAYPTVAEGDNILWSRWDSLPQPDSKPRRVLFLGYFSGLQMWDCTNLTSVSEILNLGAPSWGHFTFAGVLPPPVADDSHLSRLRPLIGMISKIQGQSVMLIYSLFSHEVVKTLPFNGVSSFASNKLFTVVSTTKPLALHVLSSASLTILHTTSSSSIFAYGHTSTHKPNTNDTVSVSGIDTHDLDDFSASDDATPIYSLSHRLLAFAAQPPRADSPHGSAALQPRTHIRASSIPFRISQGDIGSAAIKMGGTVLSGMKSLGGMAYNAAAEYAKSHSGLLGVPSVSPGARDDTRRFLTTQGDQRSSVMGGVGNLFFSRSAPAASSGNHDHDQAREHDHTHFRGTLTGDATPSSDADDVREPSLIQNASPGFYVKVLDLGPLLNGHVSSHPQVFAEFVAAKHQPITHLTFTHDGNTLLVGPKNGQVIRVYQLRRRARAFTGGVEGGHGGVVGGETGKEDVTGANTGLGLPSRTTPVSSSEEDAPLHVYNLRRGRTSAVIWGIEVSPDGRWVAVGTRKGTVHVFAINPYGGQSDLRSHMDTKIWNVDKPQPLSVELGPVARLRSTRVSGAEGLRSDLSFMFVAGAEIILPTTLLPPQMTSSPSTSSGRSDIASPLSSQRQQSFKDVLVFDASSGVLSLRRITLEQRPRDSGIPFSSPITSLATSISLPGVGAAGRLSASPPAPRSPLRDTSRRQSGLTQQLMEAATELVGRESLVATWHLKRRHDWEEVKRVMQDVGDRPKPRPSNSLAHAELSTCARAPGLVPRSIYLSHQFLFFTLGEDYHALIRRHRLAISGTKIDVRKEVEVSAFAGPSGAHFVQDLAFSPDHTHAAPGSSFDEPLASAMSAEMAHDPSTRGGRVPIPMLPNGASQQPSRGSWSGPGTRAALSGMGIGGGIPIRVMEGVGEAIRREVDRVRGGRERRPTADAQPREGLEFEAQDLEFGQGGGVSGTGAETRSGEWHAWSEEDRLAVDEAERFDDVLGIMDEDQVPLPTPATPGMDAGTHTPEQW